MKDNKDLDVKKLLGKELSASSSTENKNSTLSVDEELLRMRKIKLIKLSAIMILLSLIIVFMTLGWFSSNKFISATNGNVKVGELSYELAVDTTASNVGIISYSYNSTTKTYSEVNELNNIASLGLTNGATGTYVDTDNNSLSLYHTTGADDSIKWRLTDPYSDVGLGPDSEGTLTFYVIPKNSGTLDIDFSIMLNGYTAFETKNPNGSYNITSVSRIASGQNTDASKALDFMKGHILFFTGKTNVGSDSNPVYSYTGLIDDITEFKLSDVKGGPVTAVENVAIPVKIYWKWPNTIGQMVLEQNNNPSRKTPISTDSSTLTAIRNYVFDNETKIFKDVTNPSALMKSEGAFSTTETVNNLNTLSLGYNKADQEIGTNIDYVLVSIITK